MINSILNVPFELIYSRLENVAGFLIYFSSADSETSVFWKYFIPLFDIQVSLRAAYVKCSSWSLVIQIIGCIWGQFRLLFAWYAAKYLKFLF